MICRLAMFKNDTGINLKFKTSNTSGKCSNEKCINEKKCVATIHVGLKLFDHGDYGWQIVDKLNTAEFGIVLGEKSIIEAVSVVHPIENCFWIVLMKNADIITYNIYSNRHLISSCNNLESLNFEAKDKMKYTGIPFTKEMFV